MNPPVPELVDGRLYDLLEAEADQARNSVRLLARFIEDGGRNADVLAAPAQTSAKLADEIRAHLLQAVVTSLPKADLEKLSRTITAIPVSAARFAERYGLAADRLGGVDFSSPLNWMEELSEVLLDTVRQLRGFDSLDRVKELYPRLQVVADRAEAPIQEIVNRFYQHPAVPLDALKVKDLGDHLVEIIDRCREAGELMNGISLQFL